MRRHGHGWRRRNPAHAPARWPESAGASARAALQISDVSRFRPSVPHTLKPPSRQPVSPALLNSDHNCVRRAGGVLNRQPDEAKPRRIDHALAAAIDFADRDAIDQHGHRQYAARDLYRKRGELLLADTAGVDTRSIERELDAWRLLAGGSYQLARGPEPAERKRQFCVARDQRTAGRRSFI